MHARLQASYYLLPSQVKILITVILGKSACLNVLHKAKRNTPELMFKEGEMETGIRPALENYARLSRM